MRKLLFLVLFPVLGIAQTIQVAPAAGNFSSPAYKQTYNGTTYSYSQFVGKTFSATTDTLQAVSGIDQYTNLYIVLQSKDSISALVAAKYSIDGGTFGAATTLDSLKQSSDTSVPKSINFTTGAGGFTAVQFLVTINANAYALGTTTPTYTIKYVFKK